MDDFLAFPAVVDWLRRYVDDPVNASRSVEARGALLAYLPARLTIEMDAKAVAGELGDAASGGYFAFSLFYADTAAWNVVMDARGQLLTVAPVRSVDATGAAHFCALKNYDEDTLLLVSSENFTAAGARVPSAGAGDFAFGGGAAAAATAAAAAAAVGRQSHRAGWLEQNFDVLAISDAFGRFRAILTFRRIFSRFG